MLQIYNTLNNTKEEFTPIVPGKIGFYVCGMTVYDYCHLGHARVLISFDMITCYLRTQGFEVTYVRNITDIDDKIIKRAQENNKSVTELTKQFIDAFHEDEAALGLTPPDQEPCATQHIEAIVDLVKRLFDKDIAYLGEQGDVYFSVPKFKQYGKLSNQDLEKLRTGIRVEVVEDKRDPLDFVLWKQAKPNEPSWESPWGAGRPGWHIECSAMSMQSLGQHFDIHGGGPDLVFPHHENEIAQSEGATGETFVNTWMHVGSLQVDKEKMSKSLGNFITIRSALETYSAEDIRFFMLSSHYRSPINYSDDTMMQAKNALERLYNSMRDIKILAVDVEISDYRKRFINAMNDDFNSPIALSVLFDISHEIHRLRDSEPETVQQLATQLKQLGGLIGILQQDPQVFLQSGKDDEQVSQIEALIAERLTAREQKDWTKADEVRDKLHAMDVELEDYAGGTHWRRKTS